MHEGDDGQHQGIDGQCLDPVVALDGLHQVPTGFFRLAARLVGVVLEHRLHGQTPVAGELLHVLFVEVLNVQAQEAGRQVLLAEAGGATGDDEGIPVVGGALVLDPVRDLPALTLVGHLVQAVQEDDALTGGQFLAKKVG